MRKVDRCPRCNLSTCIQVAGYTEGAELVDVYCLNHQCPNGVLNAPGQPLRMPFARVKIPLPAAEPTGEARFCGEQLVALVTEEGYHLPPEVRENARVEGEELVLRCPYCQGEHRYRLKNSREL